jgi:hypothetical protein
MDIHPHQQRRVDLNGFERKTFQGGKTSLQPVTLRVTVSQYALVSSPICGRLTIYCFLFKRLGLKCVVLSLWSALSDERPGLSFVSHIVNICLCVHLLFTFCLSQLYHIHIYIYTHYTIHIIHTRPLLVPARYSRLCPTTH